MQSNALAQGGARVVHVEGRTPGAPGKAAMVAVEDGVPNPLRTEGSHHEAAYFAAIVALATALQDGEQTVAVTSTSEHVVEQMAGRWKIGRELAAHHDVLTTLAGMFAVPPTWTFVPR